MSGPASGVVTTTPARTTPQMGDLTSAVGELGLPGVILSSALFVAGVAGTVGGIMFLIKEKKLPFFKGKRTAKRKGQKRRK
ncbi:MAG: hypothetical protein HYX66_08895 [Ignavibacteria bacterium]|nr:hypothetical protein [Ignavibacteria bacterium]